MAGHKWRLPGRHIDWTQEAQVDQEWIGSPDRNFNGSDWDWSQGSSREYVWTDEAACAEADPELFQVTQQGDPEAGDLKANALNEYNLAKFEVALAYCEGCPIKDLCLKNADPSDRHWSVRGGELPTRIAGEARAKKYTVPSFDAKSYFPRWECKIHGLKWVSSHKKKDREEFFYCLECNRKG